MTAIALRDAPPLRVIKKLWDGVPVFGVRPPHGEQCVSFVSVRTLFHNENAALSVLRTQVRTLTVDIDGIVQDAEFVPRSVFLGVALISERFAKFRQFVVSMLEELEDTDGVLPPDVADHPAMQQLKILQQSMAMSIRAERMAAATAARQDRLEHDHSTLTARVDRAAQVVGAMRNAITHAEYAFVIPWLGAQGVRVPGAYTGQVGKEFKAIAEGMGDRPESRMKKDHYGTPTRPYPTDVIEKVGRRWMEINRNRCDRRGWFRS